jgi:hypothetical protein
MVSRLDTAAAGGRAHVLSSVGQFVGKGMELERFRESCTASGRLHFSPWLHRKTCAVGSFQAGLEGGAALTASLAALDGPWDMVGGIGVLLLLVPVSNALARYGLSTPAQAVVRGLVSKGESPRSIKAKIDKVPEVGSFG